MPSRTLVTGTNGRVGSVLRSGLAGLPLTFTDRSQLDLRDGEALRRALQAHDQVVHLASPRPRPGQTQEALDAHLRMTSDLLSAASDAGVKRVVLPSSVLATSMTHLRGTAIVGISDARPPDTAYGRSRLRMEELGHKASESGIEVVCIRLGSVRHPDAPSPRIEIRTHWLSHEDCIELFRLCLEAPIVPGRFSLFYAVSDLPARVLDVSNPFGWTPRTKRVGLRRSALSALERVNTGIRGRLQLRTRLHAILSRIRG